MIIPAQEVVNQCHNQVLQDGSIQYILLDCRTEEEYSHGHLPCAHLFDIDLVDDPNNLAIRLDELEYLKGCHICIIGGGYISSESSSCESDDTFTAGEKIIISIIRALLERSFPYVCWCRGGYIACHQLLRNSSLSYLVDHDDRKCRVCLANVSVSGSKGSRIMSSFQRIKNFVSEKSKSIALASKEFHLNQKRSEMSSTESADDRKESVNFVSTLAEWENSENYVLFRCLELIPITADRGQGIQSFHRILAISLVDVLVFEPQESFESKGQVITLINQNLVKDLQKITSKKTPMDINGTETNGSNSENLPKCITLYWNVDKEDEADGSNVNSIKRTYLVPKFEDCINLLKTNYKLSSG